MNDRFKKLVCNNTETIYSKDFQETQNIINKLYDDNHIICYNKKKIFNEIYRIEFFCSEFDKELNNIHFNKLSLIILFISYLILSDEYNRLYPIKYEKLKLDEYSEQIEYISDNCSICLNEYIIQDTIRKLKICNHIYHETCINEWVDKFNNDTCPLCRANIKV
jgi:hypothetical protein